MTRKVKVQVYGAQAKKTALLEDGATVGATLGTNFYSPQGAVYSIESLALALAPYLEGETPVALPLGRTIWSLIDEIPSDGLSVLGNPTNATARPVAIVASNNGEILRRNGSTLGFGLTMPGAYVWTALNIFSDTLRVASAAGTEFSDFAHDGTNLTWNLTNTTQIYVAGIDEFVIEAPGFTLVDSLNGAVTFASVNTNTAAAGYCSMYVWTGGSRVIELARTSSGGSLLDQGWAADAPDVQGGVLYVGGDVPFIFSINDLVRMMLSSKGVGVMQAAADPTGTIADGTIYYNTADDVFRGYTNGAWADLGGGSNAPTDVVKGGSWVRASGAIATPVNDIDIPITEDLDLVEVMILTEGGTGTCQVDVWKDTYTNFPPDDSDSITGGNEPEIAGGGGIKSSMTTFTSWTDTSFVAGDILRLHLDSSSTFTRISVYLVLRKP